MCADFFLSRFTSTSNMHNFNVNYPSFFPCCWCSFCSCRYHLPVNSMKYLKPLRVFVQLFVNRNVGGLTMHKFLFLKALEINIGNNVNLAHVADSCTKRDTLWNSRTPSQNYVNRCWGIDLLIFWKYTKLILLRENKLIFIITRFWRRNWDPFNFSLVRLLKLSAHSTTFMVLRSRIFSQHIREVIDNIQRVRIFRESNGKCFQVNLVDIKFETNVIQPECLDLLKMKRIFFNVARSKD